MARDTDRPADEQATATPCTACRGSGRVISGLGGEPQTLTCPWCEGTGQRLADHDAQAHQREQVAGG